ncbi:MAG: hypothetical protein U9R53_02730 [Chloroflexota bacterium]|nr:hypothetical protein [Chloroflexota bacterium]
MKFLKRAENFLSIGMSVLVIVLCVGAVTVAWFLQGKFSSSAVALFEGVDHYAQIMRNGIDRVETELTNLGDLIAQVEQASEDISENVSQTGIVSILLPLSIENEITTSIQSLQDKFRAVNDLLIATSEMLKALDNILFIDTLENSLNAVEALQDGMNEISDQAGFLKKDISDFRSEAGEKLSKITNTAVRLNTEVDQAQSDLLRMDTDLNAIQIQARKFQRITPTVIILIVILLTLLSGWVGYSQVTVISRSANRNRSAINGATGTDGSSSDHGTLIDRE